ncbi:unnamed protein product [Urochloa decumbens]|uniref:Uncharacterized protein n=1 Tax=Urochloa decumbens TaxID=240449 RepID=A0ABC9EH57_9POAL
MGLCFSKKKPPATPAGGTKKPGKIADANAKKTAQQPKRTAPKAAAGEPAAAGKAAAPVFVVRAKDAAAAVGEEKKKPAAAEKPLPVVVVPSAPVRTSSCTKEEVDAILIQCGRLSRSSSGTGRAASSEAAAGGHRRRRSGSKRSYDFDQDGKPGAGADEDWERQGAAAAVSSRASPHRGSPQRKRSGSRERSTGGGGSGSRRASRSPGRRTDGAAASAGSGGGERARQQQPGKMVSVPAREKGRAAAASGKRCASPRSSSPARMVAAAGNENAGCGTATGPTPALSRSSSRKAEQSPYRRNPMAELDENALRNNSNHNAKPQKKSIENAVAATPKKKATAAPSCRSGMEKPEIREEKDATVAAPEARAPPSSKTTTATRTASIAATDSLSQRPTGQPGSRSRRASRDFDQNPGSYATQLLEDIQSYHHQSFSTSVTVTAPAPPPATPSFSLPACVAKACSIVEAVADLNSSSSSENRAYEYDPGVSADDKGSVNAPPLGSGVEPRNKHVRPPPARDLHRAEVEPQESAGSNSVSGFPWTPSWEPTSVESTDRTWSAGDEVVEQSGSGSHGGRCSPMNNRPRQSSKQRPSQQEPSGRSRAGSGSGNGNAVHHRGRSVHRGSSSSVASGRSGVRVVSAAS